MGYKSLWILVGDAAEPQAPFREEREVSEGRRHAAGRENQTRDVAVDRPMWVNLFAGGCRMRYDAVRELPELSTIFGTYSHLK